MRGIRKYLSWSHLAIAIILGVIVTQILSAKFYEKPNRIIQSDVGNYYAYLPLYFIFDQLDYRFDAVSYPIVKNYVYSIPVENGNHINPSTMGMSIAYSPFFFAVHYPLIWMGYPATGFSQPYRIAIILACLFYVIFALFLLRKVLIRVFSDKVTAVALLAVILATNLFYYIVYEPGMTHAFNFSFGVYFLYFTMKWHEKPGVWSSIGLGLLTGIISLIRPTDVVVALVFILWKVDSFNTLKNNLLLFMKKWHLILTIIFFAFLVWVPQFLYWKHFTGFYFYNPYKDLGFRFFFGNPQIFLSLFSYRKGWLLYTPLMLLLLPGFIVLYRKYRAYFWPVFIYFLVNLWIVSSWCLTWYGGSYGLRAYIASYSIMAIPLAAAFSGIFRRREIPGLILGILITAVFVVHNMFQIRQYLSGAIHYISMTKEAYWDSFLREKPSPRLKYLLSYPDYESAKSGKYPTPVIDPVYTGKLTREEIILRLKLDLLQEYLGDSLKQQQWSAKAAEENLGIEAYLGKQAGIRMEEQINAGIIVPKK
jgi:hypothetical protein